MKEIKLKHGETVLVDEEDFEELNKYKWCLNSGGYATRMNDGHTSILMHRFINKTPKGLETDHINGNKLDNRRANLRSVTHSQNQIHSRLPKTNTSGFKGIVWDKKNKKWQVQIKLNQKNIYLGRYSDVELAKVARKEGEKLYFGKVIQEFKVENFNMVE